MTRLKGLGSVVVGVWQIVHIGEYVALGGACVQMVSELLESRVSRVIAPIMAMRAKVLRK